MDWLLEPSRQASPRRVRALLGALAAAALLLCLPGAALAGERADGSRLASAGLLAYGAGYGSEAGSEPVRELQRRLRSLGDRPGPIDGLYGPLTTGAVTRFQRAHGVAADGMVGPQTKARLLAQPQARASASQGGEVERKSPVLGDRTESASDPQPARDAGQLDSVAPESSSGIAPVLAALLVAAAIALLFGTGWVLGSRSRDRRAIRAVPAQPVETRLSLAMVCAALLAMFAVGAVGGALFATRAAPEDRAAVSVYGGAPASDRSPVRARQSKPPHAVAQPTPARRDRAVPDSNASANVAPVAPPAENAPAAGPVVAPPPVPAPQDTPGRQSSRESTSTVRPGHAAWTATGLTLEDPRASSSEADPTLAREELKVP